MDGPHEEDLQYYKNNTILATKDNLTIILNDSKCPFGHGYCLASILLNIDLISKL